MVQFEIDVQAPHVLKAAIQLAEKHDANLIGAYVLHPLEIYASRDADIGVSNHVTSH